MPAPSAPSGLTVLPQSGSVLLNWTVPTNLGGAAITDYRVQRRLASQTDASFVVVPDTVKATPGATIVSNNGVSYVFRVAAVNRFGVGAYSANSDVVTPYGAPTKMAAPTCTSGVGQVTINWIAPANNGSAITDYAIQRRTAGQTTYVSLVDGVSTATSYVNTGLTNGVSYFYRVAAINARGASIWSNESVVVVPSAAPNAPTNLVATAPYNATKNTAGLVALSWTAPANNGSLIQDYIIERRLSSQPDSSFAQVADAVSPAVTASIASVNGTSYVFRVAAKNAKGLGSYSANSNVATPSIKPFICPPPICTKGFNQVTLNWSPPTSNGGAEITNYIVQRKINGQANTAYVSINTGSSATSYTATGLVNGTAYVFRVAAVNIRGTGDFSPQSQLVVPGVVPPNAPTNLVATIVNETGVSLSLTAPTNNGGAAITGYTVQARPNNGASDWTTVSTNYVPGSSSPIDGLDDIATIFRVAAVNSAGTGSYSAQSADVTPSNKLFDKSSWRGVVAEPYFSYLNKAADRWYKYIRYNSANRSTIASQNSGWNGLRLESGEYTFYSNPASNTIASSGPIYVRPLGGKRYVSISFQLNINDYHRTKTNPLTENNWIDAITHELGHALGIGLYWNADVVPGATSPVDFFLDGAVYTLGQAAYNAITSQTRSKVPLENTGGTGTVNGHWENNFRPASAAGSLGVSYPGLSNELMVGSIINNMVMSRLTLKTLVDFGYEEINPGASEGNPNLASSITAAFTVDEILGKCEGAKTDKVIIMREDQESV
jgi:hypothetical protein